MNNAHNPIAHLITKIQHRWLREITADQDCRVARWTVQPQERKLYEGFLKLESTPQGSVPDKMITLLTPFTGAGNYSNHLLETWDSTLRTAANSEGLNTTTASSNTIDASQSKHLSILPEEELLSTLASFQQTYIPTESLTLCLFPLTVSHAPAFCNWMEQLLRCGIPPGIRFVIFDHPEILYQSLISKWQPYTKSVSIDLDLDHAIQKISLQGNPGTPEVQLRNSLFNMSDAVQSGNPARLKQLADNCLHQMKTAGDVGLIAMSKLLHAGMLFNFKNYKAVVQTLEEGLPYLRRGLSESNTTSNSLAVQYYGFLAAASQLNKDVPQAVKWYCMQAETAEKIGNFSQGISAWHHAAALVKNTNAQQYEDFLRRAFDLGLESQPAELFHSDYCFVGLALHDLSVANRNQEYCRIIDAKLSAVYGDNWKSTTETRKKVTKSKKPEIHSPAFQ